MYKSLKYIVKLLLYTIKKQLPGSFEYSLKPNKTIKPCYKESFSIIMPTYNRESTIIVAIDSVLKQSFQSFELIIIDDGSTDNSIKLINNKFSTAILEGKIIILNSSHNGVCYARNLGLKNVKNNWIAYLDSDNIWHKDFLLYMSHSLQKNKNTYCAVNVYNKLNNQIYALFKQDFNWDILLQNNFIDLNSYCHHISLYQELLGFDESLTRLVDWDLILRYTNKYQPKPVNALLVDYFIKANTNNISSSNKSNLDQNMKIIRKKWSSDTMN